VLRALTTAVYYRIGQICDLIEAATARPRRIIVSGGIVHSIAAMRLLADAIGRDLELPVSVSFHCVARPYTRSTEWASK